MGSAYSCDAGERCVAEHRAGTNRVCNHCRKNVFLKLRSEADMRAASALLMNMLPSDGTIRNPAALHSLVYITLQEGCLSAIENVLLGSRQWGERNFLKDYDYAQNAGFIFREWEKAGVAIGLSGCILDEKVILGFHLDRPGRPDSIPESFRIPEMITGLKSNANFITLKKYGVGIQFGRDVCSFLCKIDFNLASLEGTKSD